MSIANREAVCNVLMELAQNDETITVLCSDSRGSGSMTAFAQKYPRQFVEVGIAEQSLVSVAAGLANGGMKPVAVSPAAFLSTRSVEQIKVDCAYSHMNVKLLGISGGVSYGALGMTHHSVNDIASIASIPGMRVYLPSDSRQTDKLFRALMADNSPAYVRVGRNPVGDVYEEGNVPFTLDKANVLQSGSDLAIIACGEMVLPALKAARSLSDKGIHSTVIDMYCVKPLDLEAVSKAAATGKIVTVEEHVSIGGLGSMLAQAVLAMGLSCKMANLCLPDEPVITGKSQEVFQYYGLDAAGIEKAAMKLL